MGQEVCRTIDADPATELVCRIDVGDSLDSLVEANAEVVVDFTVLDVARETLRFAAANGIHAVVGTTGFSDDDLDSFRAAFTSSNALIAPNFAIGAVLMMRFAEVAAPFFPTAEIIELHHDQKVDAPSGTAMRTLERMAAASTEWGDDPTQEEVVDRARGGKGPAGISVHSVRLRGLVAHQQVLLGTDGETLTIRHDSMDRSSFMGGVIHACKVIEEHPGLTIGLDSYLGL